MLRWTTATPFSLVSLASYKTGCSPSLMPPSERITPLLREPIHMVESSGASRIFRLCVLIYCCLHGTVSSYLACSLYSQNTWRRHSSDSTSSALCWHNVPYAGGTVYQTFNAQWMEQPAVICQECIVAEDVATWRLYLFSVVVWRWLCCRDCRPTTNNFCLSETTDCRRFCLLFV